MPNKTKSTENGVKSKSMSKTKKITWVALMQLLHCFLDVDACIQTKIHACIQIPN